MGQNNKYLYFAIGVIVGISIGAAVVWWMQNYDFKIWFTFSGKDEKNITDLTENNENNNNKTDKQVQNVVKFDKTLKNSSSTYNDSLKSNNMETDTISDYFSSTDDNDIVVATDEMLFTKNIKIENFSNSSNLKDKNLDSLLINDRTKNNNGNLVKIEFWKSPVNYRGYKFFNNKLILFGVYNYEEASLENYNNKTYLNYQNNYYLIEKSNDFQALIATKIKKQF